MYLNIHKFANRYKDTVQAKARTQTVSLSHSIRLVIVVPHKWVEGTKLHPSYTQLLSGVASKATDVCPHQGHTEQAELQHRWRGTGAKGQSTSIRQSVITSKKIKKTKLFDFLIELFFQPRAGLPKTPKHSVLVYLR